ncbi:MAG: signal peptidase II [Pseudolysinimonas sp.]|uniref:signal peptidase II n=1 Tax=Pseudolysinimonas sp. TaxID=2680009 RepID=UPI003267AD9C
MSPRALVLLAGVAVVAFGLDQLSKYLVTTHIGLNESVPVLGEFLQLHYVTNSGAAFSLGTGFTWVYSIVAALVIVFIVWFSRRIRSLGWATMFGLVLGGAVGNVTDRLTRPPGFGVGHVVDFIQVYAFPAIFNVADIAVSSAMGLFLLLTLRNIRLDGTRDKSSAYATKLPAGEKSSAAPLHDHPAGD